jgi:hypothetical protein
MNSYSTLCIHTYQEFRCRLPLWLAWLLVTRCTSLSTCCTAALRVSQCRPPGPARGRASVTASAMMAPGPCHVTASAIMAPGPGPWQVTVTASLTPTAEAQATGTVTAGGTASAPGSSRPLQWPWLGHPTPGRNCQTRRLPTQVTRRPGDRHVTRRALAMGMLGKHSTLKIHLAADSEHWN